MASRHWNGTAWVEMTRWKRRRSNGFTTMNGFRWSGSNWIPLWSVIQGGASDPEPLVLNLDEAPIQTMPGAFDLTKAVQL